MSNPPIENNLESKEPSGKMVKKQRLEEEQRLFIAHLVAEGLKTPEINEELMEKYGLKVTTAHIHQIKISPKWKPEIEKHRREWLTGIQDVPGSSKRVRLERLERIYSRAYHEGEFKIALMAIIEQREEMEGNGSINILQFNQYSNLTNEELEEKRKEILENLQKIQIKGADNGVRRIESKIGE